MNDTVATEDLEQPAKCHERKARKSDRAQIVGFHQGQRKYAPRQQAGHMTAVDQIV